MAAPYQLIDRASEHGTTLRLYQRGEEFAIRVDNQEGDLMNNTLHYSEDVLAEIACAHISQRENPQLLVGGLGMGFTLAAALAHSRPTARIVVSELMAAVIRWNRDYLGGIAGFPLKDQRVQLLQQDVGKVMSEHANGFDAIMLDVDNGPDGFTREHNDSLYGLRGINNAYEALKPGGILTVWSAASDIEFPQRMMKVGFEVEERRVRAHATQHGCAHHIIWIGTRY